MDELLSLTGLKKVKMTAISLYKSALQFQRMPPDVRKKNPLNLCLGATVAGFFLAALFLQLLYLTV